MPRFDRRIIFLIFDIFFRSAPVYSLFPPFLGFLKVFSHHQCNAQKKTLITAILYRCLELCCKFAFKKRSPKTEKLSVEMVTIIFYFLGESQNFQVTIIFYFLGESQYFQ
ncbi:uncharacterized protein LOC123678805 isoform X2 [Harmonia axyridis]|nr:uncharacterized protein LOC123678805 isoform X2 [Harmonia axyridis]